MCIHIWVHIAGMMPSALPFMESNDSLRLWLHGLVTMAYRRNSRDTSHEGEEFIMDQNCMALYEPDPHNGRPYMVAGDDWHVTLYSKRMW